MLPKADQVVDPFHVISLANRSLDAIDAGSRSNSSAIGADATIRSIGPGVSCSWAKRNQCRSDGAPGLTHRAGRSGCRGGHAYRVKERLHDFYRSNDPDEAKAMLAELQAHCAKLAMPPEIQRLGRTIKNWFDKIANFHLAHVSNGPTEALNNLIKRIKRIGFGFRNFENYRIRALLYAASPTGASSARSSFAEQADPARFR